MRTPHRLHLSLFGITYILCLNWPRASFLSWYLHTYNIELEMGGAYAITEPHLDQDSVVIWTGSDKDSHLIHECVHAANYTLQHIGHLADFANDEVQAHLIDWIYDNSRGSRWVRRK